MERLGEAEEDVAGLDIVELGMRFFALVGGKVGQERGREHTRLFCIRVPRILQNAIKTKKTLVATN